MKRGVRDVAVNVRGAAVARIEQTIYTRKNSWLNIFRRLEGHTRTAKIARANFAALKFIKGEKSY